MDYGRFWLAGAGWLVGAIAGAAFWASRAAGRIAPKPGGGEDELITAVQTVGGNTISAALTGAFWGGIVGLVLVAAALYLNDPDRGFRIKRVETGDDWLEPDEEGRVRFDDER